MPKYLHNVYSYIADYLKCGVICIQRSVLMESLNRDNGCDRTRLLFN